MSLVKNAPRTATTVVVRSDANTRIGHSRDPYYSLMRRIFQEDATAVRGQKFLTIIEERQAAGNAIRTDEWKAILEELQVGRASFYAMRNKLLGAGLISIKNKEYRLSGQFSKDLLDMARWWWTAVLNQPEENM
ncbi:hypothetical protein RG963_07705 [Methanosarcina sp. Z-7115]|jgi:hypothetical protein|uniref:Uncharacterized protein n=1 Tax=Methanosarcina baikalica TaxID=3073890 RepID=A0ABU2D100_9EURY|nr:hypothetical protein [Methanosarcina sp. Z-7115]MCO5382430.1 hypothetical protein [Methanosarcina sp. ERenArc_MAG2]MDR7665660.1 hypothetical protein [Methanosarcina sp. Z-7115]